MNVWMRFLSGWKGRGGGARGRVTFDERGVVFEGADGRREGIVWRELRAVTVITTDEGPWRDDVFWLLEGAEGGCVVPSEAEGMPEFLERLQRLPGFNNQTVIAAMGCAQNGRFACWSAAAVSK